jgi:hypothetical protein
MKFGKLISALLGLFVLSGLMPVLGCEQSPVQPAGTSIGISIPVDVGASATASAWNFNDLSQWMSLYFSPILTNTVSIQNNPSNGISIGVENNPSNWNQASAYSSSSGQAQGPHPYDL